MANEKTAVESVPENDSVGKRIRAIEKRHGKEFMEILADLHDHVFGATPPESLEPEGRNVPVDPEAPESQQTSEVGSGG